MSFLKMRLDQVCLIRRGSTITKNQVKAGNIPVVAGGKTSTISHNEANRDANTITVSAQGQVQDTLIFGKFLFLLLIAQPLK